MPVRVSYDLSGLVGPSELTEDVARFIARANCLAGIEALIHEHHGADPHTSIAFEAASAMRRSKRSHLDSDARRLLRVAWQTELASRLGSAFDDPALLRVTSQTLPVNAYYALFNAHRALSRAEGRATDRHGSFQDGFAKTRAARLPVPWCATLEGNPETPGSCHFEPHALVTPYAFNPVERSHEPAAYLWAALRMTRRWKYDEARADWLRAKENRKRDGTVRKRLPAGEAERIANRMRPTSLLDFVYELRRRVNYETADEYGAEVTDEDIRRFHSGVVALLDSGMLVVEAQLGRRAGLAALQAVASEWTRGAKRIGPWAAERVQRRLDAVAQASGT
jgi:hypothetical protein